MGSYTAILILMLYTHPMCELREDKLPGSGLSLCLLTINYVGGTVSSDKELTKQIQNMLSAYRNLEFYWKTG
jgi:hypothetical protein